MDFDDTPGEAAFREGLRAFLAEHARVLPDDLSDDERHEAMMEWHRTLYRGGYIGLSIPKEMGGQGLSPVFDAILNEEVGRARAQGMPASTGYLARALAKYGTQEQRNKYLYGALSGEVRWCQGFSEPDAGSDLASLRTTAIRDGDVYVLNGQKVWNGGADRAKYCFLLCRTNPELPRHKGISVLIVDMDTPGVDARPIRKISGRPDFAEIFFSDARVPVSCRVGEEGQGWEIAMGTLGYERGPSDIGRIGLYGAMLEKIDAAYFAGQLRALPDVAARLARAHMKMDVLVRHVQRSLSARDPKRPPGSEGSIDKLLMIDVEQELLRIVTDVSGPETWLARPDLQHDYIWSRAASIYGGTQQIQRNIVAQRVLGLPRGA